MTTKEEVIEGLCELKCARRSWVIWGYADAIVSERCGGRVDFPRINRAIIERWSRHALAWIKKEAWKRLCAD